MKSKKDLLVVVSKAKMLMKDQNLSVSQEALEVLSKQIEETLKKAGEEARRHKRKVIKARDLNK
jgi:histone H3/H4